MFATAFVIACLAHSPLAYPLDIQVDPVTVVRGEPVRLSATVTYRGAGPVEVYASDHQDPCRYFVPPAWTPTPGAGRRQYSSVGSVTSGLWPDNPLTRTIDIGATHRAETPPGRYAVRVQAFMTQVSFPPLVEAGRLRSRAVDVTVTVTDPRAVEIKTGAGR